MFETELKAIKTAMEANEPFKLSAFIYNPWATEHNAYQGIPDPMQYKTFAHVRESEGKVRWSGSDCDYSMRASFALVCGISCLNPAKAIEVLSYQLTRAIQQGQVIITETDTNEFLIYKEETKDYLTGAAGKDLKDKNLKLIRIKFDIIKLQQLSNCPVLTCDDCC
jgi:hypothetical protein